MGEARRPARPGFPSLTQPDADPIPVEVTELLDPGRKRRDEYKAAWEQAERSWDYPAASRRRTCRSLRLVTSKILSIKREWDWQKKFSKPYPNGTWIIVYFNPTLFTAFHEDTLAFAVRIVQTALNLLGRPERIAQRGCLPMTCGFPGSV